MATSRWRIQRRLLTTASVGVLIGLSVVGCGGGAGTPAVQPAPAETTDNVATKDSQGNPAVSVAPGTAQTPPKPAIDSKFTQTFTQAAITDEIPEGVQLPVDMTIAGKVTGQLRIAVETEWDKIPLAAAESGKPIDYVVRVETTLGTFDITARPEIAPNHVRNLVALAKVGYFDGLRVDRVCHQIAVDEQNNPKAQLDLVKFGCPLGVGEEGRGHIGYFLRPEFSEEIRHEEGTVGFWREDSAESAGTRLYITLGPAPLLDKNFTVIGKVTRGIDVVKKIASQPASGETYPEIEIPKEPIQIQKVTITTP